MQRILTEEEYQELKRKADLFDSKKKGHVTAHWSSRYDGYEISVYSGDEALDILNDLITQKEKLASYWCDRFEKLENKIQNASTISLMLGERPNRFDV